MKPIEGEITSRPDQAPEELTKGVELAMMKIVEFALTLGIELTDLRMNIVDPATVIDLVRMQSMETKQ